MVAKDLTGKRKASVDANAESLTELPGRFSPGSTMEELRRPAPVPVMNLRAQAQRLHKEAHVFYFVFKHRGTRWYAKLVAICTAGYLLSPIQLIPNYIPVIGVLDDVLVVFLGAKLVQKITPAHVLAECRGLADAAEMRRKEEIKSTAAVVASVVIATLWIAAAVVASVLMARYLRH
jgi:uncharacterized membrane protein YkvA (DUF1232 family)